MGEKRNCGESHGDGSANDVSDTELAAFIETLKIIVKDIGRCLALLKDCDDCDGGGDKNGVDHTDECGYDADDESDPPSCLDDDDDDDDDNESDDDSEEDERAKTPKRTRGRGGLPVTYMSYGVFEMKPPTAAEVTALFRNHEWCTPVE